MTLGMLVLLDGTSRLGTVGPEAFFPLALPALRSQHHHYDNSLTTTHPFIHSFTFGQTQDSVLCVRYHLGVLQTGCGGAKGRDGETH
jgi:hypothetical protein